MEQKQRKKLFLSIALNALFFLAGSYFAWKRWHFQYELQNPPIAHSFRDNAQYREQTEIEKAYTDSAQVILLGDSHIFKAHWNELFHRSDIANRGIGSDVTEGFLHRLDQVIYPHARICFIEGGANDLFYYIPMETTIRNLSILIDTLRQSHIIPVLHLLPPFGTQQPSYKEYNSRLKLLNAKLKDLAQQKSIRYIDLYSLFSKDGCLSPEYSQSDGVHLTAKAYISWTQKLDDIIRDYGLKPKPESYATY